MTPIETRTHRLPTSADADMPMRARFRDVPNAAAIRVDRRPKGSAAERCAAAGAALAAVAARQVDSS